MMTDFNIRGVVHLRCRQLEGRGEDRRREARELIAFITIVTFALTFELEQGRQNKNSWRSPLTKVTSYVDFIAMTY